MRDQLESSLLVFINRTFKIFFIAERKYIFGFSYYFTTLALRRNRADTSLRQRLIDLCHVAGRSREALQLRLAALSVTPESTGEKQFEVARELADVSFIELYPNLLTLSLTCF